VRVIKSREMGWDGHVARMGPLGSALVSGGRKRRVYRFLVGRSVGKRPLGRPRRRWEDNIKVDFQELGWGEWTEFSWLRIETGGGHL
jgi:hypothetical protein